MTPWLPPLAQLRFPRAHVSAAVFEGVQAQWGVPPPGILRDDDVVDFLLDGTFTPGTSCSEVDRQVFFKGNKGVGAGLQNVQKVGDGEPLSGRSHASEDFTDSDEDFLS